MRDPDAKPRHFGNVILTGKLLPPMFSESISHKCTANVVFNPHTPELIIMERRGRMARTSDSQP
jgi:hypothetical protein